MSARLLHVGEGLALPRDTVTQTLVVYGGKGMGKTNFGTVLAEELSACDLRFAVLDPVGVWHGLEHDASGKGPGISVLILGGRHGDLPIEPTGGAVVADFVADEEMDVVVDISRKADGRMWSAGEQTRFVRDFSARLYERQGERRRPVHLIFDEAGRFVPQQIPHGNPELSACIGAIERLVELGRNVGIGITLITQRSARMNKSVSELAECMVAFRTVGPRSVEAVMDWLGEHVDRARQKELVDEIRSLPRGAAMVVSPGWLSIENVHTIRARTTFDTSGTPTGGERKATGRVTKPDLGKYRDRMQATIQKAEQDDPRALRARILQLEGQLDSILDEAKAKVDKQLGRVQEKRVEVPVLKDAQIARLEKVIDRMAQAGEAARALARSISDALAMTRRQPPPASEVRDTQRMTVLRPMQTAARIAALPKAAVQVDPDPPAISDYALGLLRTLAEREPMKLTTGQLAALSGRSARSSAFDSAMAKLRKMGLVESQGGNVVLTAAGRSHAGEVRPAPTTPEEIQAAWLRVLPDYERALLEPLLELSDAEVISKEELGRRAQKSHASSAFDSAMASLRRNGLVDGVGTVRATPIARGEAR